MKTAILEVFAVDMAKAVGFRRIEPTGPAGDRFGLYLPSMAEPLVNFGTLIELMENKIMDPLYFDLHFSYITIHSGDYGRDSKNALGLCLVDFPMTKDCRLNSPISFLYGSRP